LKTIAQINIERLSREDRIALLAILRAGIHQAGLLHSIGLSYEGPTHTALDRAELELRESMESLRRLLGEKQVELLLEPDNLNPIVKSSV
jgi:hypothetical protein